MAIFMRGNVIIYTMSMLFIFSTIYTMIYYYNIDSGQNKTYNALGDSDGQSQAGTEGSILSSITSGFIDNILSFLSIINPFGFVILILKEFMPESAFTFIDLLILRPVGWVGTMILSDLTIRYIRGVSE